MIITQVPILRPIYRGEIPQEMFATYHLSDLLDLCPPSFGTHPPGLSSPDRDGGQGEKVLHLRVQQVCHLEKTTKTEQDPHIHMCVGEYIYIYENICTVNIDNDLDDMFGQYVYL